MLRVIRDRWGPDLEGFVGYAEEGPGLLARNTKRPPGMLRAAQVARSTDAFEGWIQKSLGSAHLGDYLHVGMESTPEWKNVVRLTSEKVPADYSVVLAADRYPDLFEALRNDLVDPDVEGQSRRVGLLSPPIGWLGVYRKSRITGSWFRGRHRWHELGN